MAKKTVSRRWRQMASKLSKSGDGNYCAVIAIAIATGEDVSTVQTTLADCGRDLGDGTTRPQLYSALRHLGYSTRDASKSKLGRMLEKCRTVNQIDNLAAKGTDGQRFLVLIKGHVLAVAHDRVNDWTRDRKHRPYQVLEVTSNLE